MATTFRNRKNYPLGAGTLNTTITSSGLTIILDAGQGANFPSATFTITIDEEIILIDSRATDTLTVNASGRGYDGTTASAHAAASTIANYQIVKDFTDLETAVNAIENGTAWPTGYAITRDDSGTNNVASVLALYHTSTGVPASGLGAKHVLGAENSAGTAIGALELHGYLTTVTAGAEQGAFLMRLMNAGALMDAIAVSVAANTVTLGSGQATANLWNDTATLVNAFGKAATVNLCANASAGSIAQVNLGDTSTVNQHRIINLRNNTSGYTTLIMYSEGATEKWRWGHTYGTDTIYAYCSSTAATEFTIATTGVTVRLDLAVNGGDLTSTASTFNLLASPTTIVLGAAATTLTLGAATGTCTIQNATVALTGATAFNVTPPATFTGSVTLNGAANVLGDASTDLLTFTGRCVLRAVTDAGPMTATAGTAGEIVRNTSDNKFYGCTVTHASAATWVALN